MTTTKVIIINSPEDELFRTELITQLLSFEQSGKIKLDHEFNAEESHVDRSLYLRILEGDIIFLLLSQSFFSNYQRYELSQALFSALYRHESRNIIPIIVRPFDYNFHSPLQREIRFETFLPIINWPDREEAWNDLKKLINQILTDLYNKKTHVFLKEEPIPPQFKSIQFDGIFPNPFRSQTWQDIIVYVYFRHAIKRVLADFEKRKLNLSGTYSGTTTASKVKVQHDSSLTIIPNIPYIVCNPPSIQFKMVEDFHCLQFRAMFKSTTLAESLAGGRINGTIQVYLEALMIGEIPVESTWEPTVALPSRSQPSLLVHRLAAQMKSVVEQSEFTRRSSTPFRKIFVSYAHKDTSIIKSLEKAYKILGDDYWRDFESLRSGEIWSKEIEKAIGDSDIFQLCWSKFSKSSAFVEQEWRKALTVEKENFIRPVYWEKPIPEPPSELSRLHFAYYPHKRWYSFFWLRSLFSR